MSPRSPQTAEPPSRLRAGQRAPDWSLPSGNGQTVSLSALRGRRVVLYFYPKDDTSGCTKEACDFQGRLPEVTKSGVVLFGISRDSAASHEKFAKKYGLSFPLLSDEDAAVCKAYGVYKQKSMYGRTYWGIERTTFVIDEAGRIAMIFPKVKVDGHADEVLEAVRKRSLKAPASSRRAV